ncbi:hypothetical protein Sa4125_31770 [Aureimonas sp. SA4125]|uniref:DUF4381 family protein n=1 Tax=Aureimonas sp. SA4125 TaxID=2826993 RepID=UPI001CC79239|nr:DUF4381 family protein [Aureimonas sp. SA4125]BDA85635.1 hypothetical protein Sa4125_31770 [Aureimonas sp. SA4125]
MQDADKILAALRPPHLPPAASALTLGDLALPIALGLLLALVVALLWPTRIKGRRRVRMNVLAELAAARSLPPEAAVVAEARLLRKMVVARDGTAAALAGPDFATACDRQFGTDFFTAGPGRRLTTALYAPGGASEAEDIGAGLESLFRGIRA